MGLETATFISELNSANPTSSDAASQGDDHIYWRRLKINQNGEDPFTEIPCRT